MIKNLVTFLSIPMLFGIGFSLNGQDSVSKKDTLVKENTVVKVTKDNLLDVRDSVTKPYKDSIAIYKDKIADNNVVILQQNKELKKYEKKKIPQKVRVITKTDTVYVEKDKEGIFRRIFKRKNK